MHTWTVQAVACLRNRGNRENGILNEGIDRVFTYYTICLNAYVHIGRHITGFRVTMETVKASIRF
jgi:hypothetical protein